MFTSRQITLVAAGLMLFALCAVFCEVRLGARQRDALHAARARHDALTAQLERLHRESAAAEEALTTARQALVAQEKKIGENRDGSTSAIGDETNAWLARLQEVRDVMAQHPEVGIPELSLLSDREWLRIAKDAQFETPEQIRKSLAALRNAAKEQFAVRLASALGKYLRASGGQLPPTALTLAGYFTEPVDLAIFQRYEVVRTGNVSDLPDRTLSVIREKAPVDKDYDSRYGVDGNAIQSGGGFGNARTWVNDPDGYDGMIQHARAAYARANNGAKTTSLEQLAPYINPPLSPAALRKLIDLEQPMER